MYMIIALYINWVWMCQIWFKALWCNCTADSVRKLFIHCCLYHDAGDCTADSVIKLIVYYHLYYNAGDCTVDLVVELFVYCCFCCGAC